MRTNKTYTIEGIQVDCLFTNDKRYLTKEQYKKIEGKNMVFVYCRYKTEKDERYFECRLAKEAYEDEGFRDSYLIHKLKREIELV